MAGQGRGDMTSRCGLRTAVRIAAAAMAAVLLAAGGARALIPRDLAGWWIAIDDAFPKAWERRDIVAMEEVLIVGRDGRVENRVMNFWAGSPQACAETKVCSDLPLIAAARLRLKGNRLSFVNRHASGNRLDAARGDALIRRLAVTSTPRWTIHSGDGQLTLRAGATTRVFARIDPDRLRRLRAGLRVSALAATKHWRCFLANATAREAAFAPLRKEYKKASAPNFLDRYLRVASYLAALDAMLATPTADDPDEKTRKLIGHATEQLMIVHFDDVRVPASMADKKRLQAQREFVERRGKGESAYAANYAVAYRLGDVAKKIPLRDADLLGFGKALGDDAAAKKLFCRE
jgi:hypothetical protein